MSLTFLKCFTQSNVGTFCTFTCINTLSNRRVLVILARSVYDIKGSTFNVMQQINNNGFSGKNEEDPDEHYLVNISCCHLCAENLNETFYSVYLNTQKSHEILADWCDIPHLRHMNQKNKYLISTIL